MNKYNLEFLSLEITKNYKNKEIQKNLYDWLLWIFELDDFLENSENDINLRLQIINDLINHQSISNHYLVNNYNNICNIIKNNFTLHFKNFEKRTIDYLIAVKNIYIDSVIYNINTNEFFHLRLNDSGAYIIQTFIEFEIDCIIPDDLLEIICIIITLTNDMYSYKKEMNMTMNVTMNMTMNMTIISNFIIYLTKIRLYNFEKALDYTYNLLKNTIDKFYTYKDNKFYHLLEQLIEANNNWHEITYRYKN